MRLARALSLLIGFALLSGLSQCESQTCYDFDEEGNRFEFPCTTCAERDDNPCTADAWNIEPGLTCSLDQQPVLEDGAECEFEGSAGVCNAGVCEAVPVLAAGTYTTTWRANTLPLGSNGGDTANDGGCLIVTPTGPVIYLDTTIRLTATSDGRGNLLLEYEFILNNFLFPTLTNAAEYGNLTLFTELSNAATDRVATTAEPSVVGQLIGNFIEGTSFVASTPEELVEVNTRVTPLGPGPVHVNWSGELLLEYTLGGNPLIQMPETDCLFDQQGPDIVFDVIQP